MNADILERLWFLCNKLTNGNVTAFAKKMGINQKTLSQQMNNECKVSLSVLLPILSSLPELSAEWLFRGNGEMNFTDSLSQYRGDESEGELVAKISYDKLKTLYDHEVEINESLRMDLVALERYNQRLVSEKLKLEERLSKLEPQKKDII